MSAPLSMRKRMQIVKLWFEGYSEDAIRRHADVGKGTVGDVIARMKGGEYEEFVDVVEIVDMLREIAVFVRKHMAGDLERCFIGSAMWAALNRMDIAPSQIKDFVQMCEDLTPADMPRQEFVKVAIWCHHIGKELGIDLLDLPKRIEELRTTLEALRTELAAREAEVRATEVKVRALRTELGLSGDIKGIRAAHQVEQARFAEAEGRTKAAMEASRVTLQALERFRVLEGTAKAKGVPLDGELFDTLLSLIALLGPDGVRDAAELRSLMDNEGLSPSEGLSLLLGLWKRGLTLRRATAIVRALGTRDPFSASLNRLMSLLEKCGTLEVAVATLRSDQQALWRQGEAKRAELAQLDRMASAKRSDLADAQHQVEQVAGERDGIQAEKSEMVAEYDAKLEAFDIEQRRAEDLARGATEAAAEALGTCTSAEAVAAALARKREELATLDALIPVAGRNLGALARKTREMSAPIQVAAYVPALIHGKKEGLGALTWAARTGVLDAWEARNPTLTETAARWLREQLIETSGRSLVSVEECVRRCKTRDEEIEVERGVSRKLEETFQAERGRMKARIMELEGTLAAERGSLRGSNGKLQRAEGMMRDAEERRHALAEQLSLMQRVLPTVREKQFTSTEEFHRAVVGAVEADVRSKAVARYQAWQRRVLAEGRFAVVREYTRRIPCPCGRDLDIRVTSQYVAQVVAGFRPGALFPRLGQPGIALERCPVCGRTVRLTLDDIVG